MVFSSFVASEIVCVRQWRLPLFLLSLYELFDFIFCRSIGWGFRKLSIKSHGKNEKRQDDDRSLLNGNAFSFIFLSLTCLHATDNVRMPNAKHTGRSFFFSYALIHFLFLSTYTLPFYVGSWLLHMCMYMYVGLQMMTMCGMTSWTATHREKDAQYYG